MSRYSIFPPRLSSARCKYSFLKTRVSLLPSFTGFPSPDFLQFLFITEIIHTLLLPYFLSQLIFHFTFNTLVSSQKVYSKYSSFKRSNVSRPILYIHYIFNSKSSYIIDIRNNREFAHSPYRGISTIPCSTYISLRPELTLFQPMYTLYHNVSPNYRLHDTLCIARPTFGASGSPCTQFLPLSLPPCTTPFTSSKGRARATR